MIRLLGFRFFMTKLQKPLIKCRCTKVWDTMNDILSLPVRNKSLLPYIVPIIWSNMKLSRTMSTQDLRFNIFFVHILLVVTRLPRTSSLQVAFVITKTNHDWYCRDWSDLEAVWYYGIGMNTRVRDCRKGPSAGIICFRAPNGSLAAFQTIVANG